MKVKPITIGLLLLIGITFNSLSQTITFHKYFNNNPYETPRNLFFNDSNYVIVSLNYINNELSIQFYETDIVGNILRTKSFHRPGFNLFLGFTSNRPVGRVSDGSFLLPILAQNIQFSNYTQICLMKVNENWDSLWTRVFFTDTNYMEINQVREDSDGNYILVGSIKRDSALNYTAPLDLNMLYIKTDTSGNIITYNMFGTSGYDGSKQLYELPNKNYLCYGYTSGFAPDSILFDYRGDGYLCELNHAGLLLSQNHYGRPLGSDQALSFFLQTGNNCFYTGGGKGAYDFGDSYGNKWLIKLDSNYQITKELLLGQIGSSKIVDFINNFKNNYIGLCDINETLPLITRRFAEIFEMDSYERITWYRKVFIADTSVNQFFIPAQIISIPDSGYAILGYGLVSSMGIDNSSYLIKTDSLGCDGYWSCSDTALVVEILNYPDTLCQNDTNFVEVRLKGRSAPYSLYANGTLVLDSIYYPYILPLWIDTTIMVFPTDTGWQPLIVTLHEPWERLTSDTVQVYVVHCPTTFASQDFYKRKVEIFPNPASTELHVKIRGVVSGAYTIMLYDIQGKPIRSLTTKETETILDISQLPVGVYGVKVLGNGVYRMEKVVKL